MKPSRPCNPGPKQGRCGLIAAHPYMVQSVPRGHTHIYTHTRKTGAPGISTTLSRDPISPATNEIRQDLAAKAWLTDMVIVESGITRCLAGANRFLAGLAALAGGPGTSSKTRRITSGLGRVLSGSQPGSGNSFSCSLPFLLLPSFTLLFPASAGPVLLVCGSLFNAPRRCLAGLGWAGRKCADVT